MLRSETTLAARNVGADRRLDVWVGWQSKYRANTVSAVGSPEFAVKWQADVPVRPRLRRIAIQFRGDISAVY